MKPGLAKAMDSNTLEEVGRATLQIVHDLKNQLNGLKLYATFLRKRLEQDNRAVEERETLAKLISGLDRAARDMTVLVSYARPLELHRRPYVDLRKIVTEVIREVSTRHANVDAPISSEIDQGDFRGEFDSVALSQALSAMIEQRLGAGRNRSPLILHLRKVNTHGTDEALIEIEGPPRNTTHATDSSQSFQGHASLHAALAARIFNGHGGRAEFDANVIRAWLPLSA